VLAEVEPRLALDPDVPLASVPESLDDPLPAEDPLLAADPLLDDSPPDDPAEELVEARAEPECSLLAPELVPSVCFAAAAVLFGGGRRDSHFMMPIAIACA
jgi:hypothetical protein